MDTNYYCYYCCILHSKIEKTDFAGKWPEQAFIRYELFLHVLPCWTFCAQSPATSPDAWNPLTVVILVQHMSVHVSSPIKMTINWFHIVCGMRIPLRFCTLYPPPSYPIVADFANSYRIIEDIPLSFSYHPSVHDSYLSLLCMCLSIYVSLIYLSIIYKFHLNVYLLIRCG